MKLAADRLAGDRLDAAVLIGFGRVPGQWPELVFHAFVVALAQFAALAVEDPVGQGVALFLEVAAAAGVVDPVQHMQGLVDEPVVRDRLLRSWRDPERG